MYTPRVHVCFLSQKQVTETTLPFHANFISNDEIALIKAIVLC